jgi:hypothetical protein
MARGTRPCWAEAASSKAFVNGPVANLYGLAGVTGDELRDTDAFLYLPKDR